ncbi:MAG: hypothetical protein M1839_006340 [Geoglossum umbratile]|nr:MAG: hypothetical protein M1839_006340 [Geoglossum umbratile]
MSAPDYKALFEAEQRKREEAEARADNAEAEAAELEKLTRLTTLSEFLDLCHTHLFQTIAVQTDPSLSTQGDGVTSVKGKTRPRFICPWPDFGDTLNSTWDRLRDAYPPSNPRAFHHLACLKTCGEEITTRLLASEPDVAYLMRLAIKSPTSKILRYLHTLPELREEFHLDSTGIVFDNHPNALSDRAEEVILKKMAHQTLRPSTPICVYTTEVGGKATNKVAFVIEYKPPHLITTDLLRLALSPDRDPIPVDDFVNAISSPAKDNPLYLQHRAETIVAKLVTQAFSYMIEGNTCFGYITTGEAWVFLYISLDDPATVYYHLAEPRSDVETQRSTDPATESYLNRTAISQVVAFSLLALESPPPDQAWATYAETLPKWVEDPVAVLDQLPPTVRKTPPGSTYWGRAGSPPNPREGHRPRNALGFVVSPTPKSRSHACRPPDSSSRNDNPPRSPHESEEEGPQAHSTAPRRVTRSSKRTGHKASATASSAPPPGNKTRQYCTHKCLHGLVSGSNLDLACPNVSDHCRVGHTGVRHRLNGEKLLLLLRKQLQRTRDEHCDPLGRQGARGALFQVTLASHGYTMVAKGTVTAFVDELQHESLVYQRLRPLQGVCVPVCLGSIDLVHPYFYDVGVRIIHMMFMSWASPCLAWDGIPAGLDVSSLKEDLVVSVSDIHRAGVLHRDVRLPNICWSGEAHRVMLIDFERSELLDARAPLSGMPLNTSGQAMCDGYKGSCRFMSAGNSADIFYWRKKRSLHETFDFERLGALGCSG